MSSWPDSVTFVPVVNAGGWSQTTAGLFHEPRTLPAWVFEAYVLLGCLEAGQGSDR